MSYKQTEKRWREEKYRVMFHSQKYYNTIRIAMRDRLPHEHIEDLIQDASLQTPTQGSKRNACQHMWGYFRHKATPEEKQKYMEFLNKNDFSSLLVFFQHLADHYHISYLQNSTILQNK